MDARSEQNLQHVHPDLVKVIRATPQLPRGFIVIHGLRTLAEEAQMVAGGHSQTMHSRHLPNAQGLACAIDFAAMDQGHVSWADPLYRQVWVQISQTAEALKIPVEWGGDWTTLKDWGHVQLPWKDYP